MAVEEWPDEDSFHAFFFDAFFNEAQPEVVSLMQALGAAPYTGSDSSGAPSTPRTPWVGEPDGQDHGFADESTNRSGAQRHRPGLRAPGGHLGWSVGETVVTAIVGGGCGYAGALLARRKDSH